jgi:hypothetical protein
LARGGFWPNLCHFGTKWCRESLQLAVGYSLNAYSSD